MRNYSEADVALLVTNNISQDEVNAYDLLFPGENIALDAAIGSIAMLRAGHGQDRNRPFANVGEVAL